MVAEEESGNWLRLCVLGKTTRKRKKSEGKGNWQCCSKNKKRQKIDEDMLLYYDPSSPNRPAGWYPNLLYAQLVERVKGAFWFELGENESFDMLFHAAPCILEHRAEHLRGRHRL